MRLPSVAAVAQLSQNVADALVRRFEDRRGAVDPFALPPFMAELRDRTAAFVDRHVLPRLDELDHDLEDGRPDAQLLREGAKAGLLTASVPRLFGGDASLGAMFRHGTLHLGVMVEELARGCAGVSVLFGAHHLGILPILLSGDLRQYVRILMPLARAARGAEPQLFAFAITEPGAGSDVEDEEGSRTARLGTFARRERGGYVLSGRKVFISNGSAADVITVFAALDRAAGVKSWTCFAVRTDSPGFSVGRVEKKMGQKASPAAEIVMEDVFVPEADRIGREGDGWKLNGMTLDTSRAGVGAIALGVARGALDVAVAEAAGRGLLGHADVRHELADLMMKVETLRSLVWRACRTFPPIRALSATAKCVGGDIAVEVCARAMALFGDAGATRALGLEKRLRDARLIQIFEGTNEINRLAVAEERLPKA